MDMFQRLFNNARSNPRSGHHRPDNRRSPSTSSNPSSPSSSKKAKQDEGIDDLQACQVDNSTAAIAKYARLFADRLLNDITIVINGVEYPTHRLILCASSDVFQIMLMGGNWTESAESRVVLQESAECADVFEEFLKYLYTGMVKFQLSRVLHLLVLADKYNVKDLVSLCLTYMEMHIPAAAQHNQLILWYQYTSNFGQQHRTVAQCCRNYIKWNLEEVCKAEDFPHLDIQLLISILQEDDVVVQNENQLYQIVDYWLYCRMERRNEGEGDMVLENEFLRMVERIMEHIRLPMLTPRQIADLIQSPLVRNCKLIMDRMALAMAFHNGCCDQTLLGLQAQDTSNRPIEYQHFYLSSARHPNYKLFNPRLYTDEKYSVLMPCPFSRMQHYQSRALVFSTPHSFSDYSSQNDGNIDWCLDFYPKGVEFQKYGYISWQRTTDMKEHILKTVRLYIHCRTESDDDIRVRIGILLFGQQDGVEHIRKATTKNYIFTAQDRMLRIDNIIPYGDLNPCAGCSTRRRLRNSRSPSPWPQPPTPPPETDDIQSSVTDSLRFGHVSPTDNSDLENPMSCFSCRGAGTKSCYLINEGSDTNLKLRIIVTPLP